MNFISIGTSRHNTKLYIYLSKKYHYYNYTSSLFDKFIELIIKYIVYVIKFIYKRSIKVLCFGELAISVIGIRESQNIYAYNLEDIYQKFLTVSP